MISLRYDGYKYISSVWCSSDADACSCDFLLYNIYICWCINKCKCILYINSINMITCCGGGRGVLIRWPVMNINGNWRCANVTRCVRGSSFRYLYILSHAYAETCLFSKLVYNYARVSISSPACTKQNFQTAQKMECVADPHWIRIVSKRVLLRRWVIFPICRSNLYSILIIIILLIIQLKRKSSMENL